MQLFLSGGNIQVRKTYPEEFFTGMTWHALFLILPKKIALSSEILWNPGYGIFPKMEATAFRTVTRLFETERRYNVFTVGRAKFDRWFAEQASQKGAMVVCGTVVTDLLRDENGFVTGVQTDRPDGDLNAKVVLLADGINSPLAAKTGFRPEPSPSMSHWLLKRLSIFPRM
jgi:flavin-dependent dehydrogenase